MEKVLQSREGNRQIVVKQLYDFINFKIISTLDSSSIYCTDFLQYVVEWMANV
jgi:hypothetical protein